MKRVVIYLRVSTKEQKEEGYSIPAQKKLLWEFAQANGFKVVKEFEDDETAKMAGRTGFGKMVEFLKNNKDVNTILVEKTDRLYRNFKDYVIIDELGVTVFLVKENEKLGEDASSHQKFIHGIKVLMAKNYIDNLSEEVRKGLRAKAESGIYPCNILPVGYKLEKVGEKSMPVVDEKNKNLPIKMFEYYSTGLYSLDKLVQKVKDEGLLILSNIPKTSKLKVITKSTAQRILINPFYYGDFLWKGKLYHGTHDPLVSRELWDKVQRVLNRFKNKEMLSKYNTLFFTFKGLLTCGECGRTITAQKKIKPSGKEYVYYRCTKFGTNCSQKAISEKDLDKQVIKALEGLKMPPKTIEYVTEGLRQSLYIKRDTEDKMRVNFEEEKNRLQNRLSVLYEDKLDGNITQEFYSQKFDEYSNKIKELDRQVSKYTDADIDYYKFGTSILELANKASFLYKKANPEEKQELLNFLLSNSTLEHQKVLIQYKKPFDRVFARATCNEWRTGRDSNP